MTNQEKMEKLILAVDAKKIKDKDALAKILSDATSATTVAKLQKLFIDLVTELSK